MVGALQQADPIGLLNFSMNKESLPADRMLVEIKHPLTVFKSDLYRMLGYTRFSQITPYFESHIFPHFNFQPPRAYRNISKFNEAETQVIFAILFQKGRLTQKTVDAYCKEYKRSQDALTEVIVKTETIQLTDSLWIITKNLPSKKPSSEDSLNNGIM